MSEYTFFRYFSPAIQYLARKEFADRPDVDEKIWDCEGVGWELYQQAPETATPTSIAHYAVKRVKVNRQFSESERSIDKPIPLGKRRGEPSRRTPLSPYDLVDPTANPAELAGLKIDVAEWGDHLTKLLREYLVRFVRGESNTEIAEHFGVSNGRVSQIRRQLAEDLIRYRS